MFYDEHPKIDGDQESEEDRPNEDNKEDHPGAAKDLEDIEKEEEEKKTSPDEAVIEMRGEGEEEGLVEV